MLFHVFCPRTQRRGRRSCPHRHRIRTGLFEPKSPLRGNGIFRAETKRPKRPWRFKDAGPETKSRQNSANSGLIAGFREISVRTRMRGGAERSPTWGEIKDLQRVRVEIASLSANEDFSRTRTQHYPLAGITLDLTARYRPASLRSTRAALTRSNRGAEDRPALNGSAPLTDLTVVSAVAIGCLKWRFGWR